MGHEEQWHERTNEFMLEFSVEFEFNIPNGRTSISELGIVSLKQKHWKVKTEKIKQFFQNAVWIQGVIKCHHWSMDEELIYATILELRLMVIWRKFTGTELFLLSETGLF